MTVPPFATAAATSAICSGVVATSPWPMPASAKSGLFCSNVPGGGPLLTAAPGSRSSGGAA